MRYTFELSYHHNNPMPSSNFTVVAKNNAEAVAKAFYLAMEHLWGDNYSTRKSFAQSFPVKYQEIVKFLKSKETTHIFKLDDQEMGETWYVHVWNEYDDHVYSDGKPGGWNRGFGAGGPEENSTDKHENVWVRQISRGTPKTKDHLIAGIQGMVYNLNKLSHKDLIAVYNLLTAKSRNRNMTKNWRTNDHR